LRHQRRYAARLQDQNGLAGSVAAAHRGNGKEGTLFRVSRGAVIADFEVPGWQYPNRCRDERRTLECHKRGDHFVAVQPVEPLDVNHRMYTCRHSAARGWERQELRKKAPTITRAQRAIACFKGRSAEPTQSLWPVWPRLPGLLPCLRAMARDTRAPLAAVTARATRRRFAACWCEAS